MHGENVAENPQNKMLGIMHFMNKQLGATGYVARTDNLSVADLAAYATVSTIKVGACILGLYLVKSHYEKFSPGNFALKNS